MSLINRDPTPEQKRQAEERKRQLDEQKKHFSDMTRVQARLLAEEDPALDALSIEGYRAIDRQLDAILVEEKVELSIGERKSMVDTTITVLNSGPLRPLLADPMIVEIMVNSPQEIFIEYGMQMCRSDVVFEDVDELLAAVNRMVAPTGQRLDAAHPIVNARLSDGTVINAVLDPVSVHGPTITIRKFSKVPLTVQNLIDWGSVTIPVMEFLRAAVIAEANIVVCSQPGQGKSTLLDILSNFIPTTERKGLHRRDRVVLEAVQRYGVPVALAMSGGYARTPELTADLHAIVHREAQRVFGG